MRAWYKVIYTVKGHRYAYWQRSYPRSERRYVGPVSGGWGMAPKDDRPSSGAGDRPPAVMTTLSSAGDDHVIAVLMDDDEPGAVGVFRPAYEWGLPPRPEPIEFEDREILVLGTRMGVNMLTQIGVMPKNDRDCPVYFPMLHKIRVPDPSRYWPVMGVSAARNYCVDLLHEVAHSTQNVLGRPLSFDAESAAARRRLYRREEVVAELSANLVLARLGLAPEDPERSRAYLAGYRTELSEKDVAWAIAEARKAADHILSFHSRGGWTATRDRRLV